ncbi:MAG: hypothetical protein GSR86_00130 [Desulfurococcales archaeon]|nr:hypothetical protein [Desulfurococcales archaeon]
MGGEVLLATCTGDPLRCAELDLQVLSVIGVHGVIGEGEGRVVKASWTSGSRAELLGAGRILVAGPGVVPEPSNAHVIVDIKDGMVSIRGEGVEWVVESFGCDPSTAATMYSAAIAGYLAKGYRLGRAVEEARVLVEHALTYTGCKPRPIALLEYRAARQGVVEDLKAGLKRLLAKGGLLVKAGLVPEVGINIAEALPHPYTRSPGDVAAFPGRIMRTPWGLEATHPCPEFGSSSHLARAILAMMRVHEDLRAAVNIRYSKEAVRAAEALGYRVSYYDRREEPREVKEREGATIPWGVEYALKRVGYERLDLIYHTGDWGKEPMITVFAKTAEEAVVKVLALAGVLVNGIKDHGAR